MFSGAYEHSVDSKGRTVIPAKFRARLGERFYLTRGLHGCLWVFADQHWSEFQKKLTPRSLLDSDALKLERYFLGSAVECMPDGQGRIGIPENLRQFAGIDGDIWVVGLGTRVEIWSNAKWEEFNNSLTDEVIQNLGQTLDLAWT